MKNAIYLLIIVQLISSVISQVMEVRKGASSNYSETFVKQYSVEQQLIRKLLEGYVPLGRPVVRASRAVTTEIDLYLQQIANVDERQQVFISRGWLYVVWDDELIFWDPADYDGLKFVSVSPTDIWTPDLAIGNSVGKVFDESYQDVRIVVQSNGTVNWFPGGVFKTACTISITYFPFDSQKCTLIIQQWNTVEDTHIIQNKSSVVYLSEYMENGEWEVDGTDCWKHTDDYPLGVVGQIYFDFYITRKPSFYVMNIIFPCLMISSLSMMVFYLPPDSGEKITLGTTVLLAFTVFLLLISGTVPRTSDLPILTLYITMSMLSTTISVLFSIIVLRIHHHDTSTPTGPIFKIIYAIFSRVNAALMVRRMKESTGSDSLTGSENHLNYSGHGSLHDSPLLSMENGRLASTRTAAFLMSKENSHKARRLRLTKRSKTLECIEKDELKFRFMAMVCDRLLLFLFFVINTVMAVVILIIVPLNKSGFVKEHKPGHDHVPS